MTSSGLVILDRLQPFRDHLIGVAAARLEALEPGFVEQVKASGGEGMDALLARTSNDLPLNLTTRQQFARDKSLLNQYFQVQLSIRELRVAVVLIGYPGHDDTYAELGVQDDERFYHLLQSWSVVRSSLFERAKRLTTMCIRRLPILTSVDKKEAEKRFADQLDQHRFRMKLLRDTAAHGGYMLDDLETTSIFELAAAVGYWPDDSVFYSAIWENRVRYRQGTLAQCVADYDAVGAALEDLDAGIDWGAARSARPGARNSDPR